jgi:hypothetical protein
MTESSMETLPLTRSQAADALAAARGVLLRWQQGDHDFLYRAKAKNPWFTLEFQQKAFQGLAQMLDPDAVEAWLGRYPAPSAHPKMVGLVMAGNLPLVGLHDVFCIIASGHRAKIKPSSQDNVLPQQFVNDWLAACSVVEGRIEFIEQLKNFDAVIATGSNNSSRYFDFYFSKYPSIVRKNRNSIAVLTGDESEQDLDRLADDVFLFFGFGCRSVSSLLLPEGADLGKLARAFEKYEPLGFHNKFANNLDYHRALFLLNQEPFYDLGGILLHPTNALHSPGSVVNLIYYKSLEDARQWIATHQDDLQVVISNAGIPGQLAFGIAQMPGLSDYADQVDTMQFLHSF